VAGERVGVRGSTKKHLKYCFYCNPSYAAFPASGSRNPYLYSEERERHPVIPNLCKGVRDVTFSP
jgi:hypothetical protein